MTTISMASRLTRTVLLFKKCHRSSSLHPHENRMSMVSYTFYFVNGDNDLHGFLTASQRTASLLWCWSRCLPKSTVFHCVQHPIDGSVVDQLESSRTNRDVVLVIMKRHFPTFSVGNFATRLTNILHHFCISRLLDQMRNNVWIIMLPHHQLIE